MAAMSIHNRVQAFPISNQNSQFDEVEFDLQIYFNQIEQSMTWEGELDSPTLSTIHELSCGDPERRFAALIRLPKVYNFKDEDINVQIVPILVNNLRRSDWPQLQIHAARILRYLGKKNIFSLTSTGAAPEFVNLLGSPNEDVQQQAIWALHNLVEMQVKISDGVSLNEMLFLYLKIYFHHRPKVQFTLFRDALFLMVKISQCEPIDKTIDFLRRLKPLLEKEEDEEMLKEVCKAVLQYSGGVDERKEAIEQTGIYPKLVKLLFHSSLDVLQPVIKTIANLARVGIYDDILSNKVLSRILVILSTDTMKELHIQICQIISRITEGTQDEIDLLIRADLFHPLVGFLCTKGQSYVKEEAAYAICTAIREGREEQVKYFVDLGCLEILGDLLTPKDALLTRACLNSIETMLKVAVGSHKYTNLFQSARIRTRIYELSEFHSSWDSYHEEIYKQGKRIRSTYLEPWPDSDSGDNTKKSRSAHLESWPDSGDSTKKSRSAHLEPWPKRSLELWPDSSDSTKKSNILVCEDWSDSDDNTKKAYKLDIEDWEYSSSECEDNFEY
ncbi:importin subunit alpha-1b [Cryptomeria japonica]|uniref:importin subunit alpha-1b n=1 Tax=Cryptomeria japonica TaxID=3369 RepID=UPI0025AC04A0|nr:importin subunit alpha-1b [Cryptomeria japonica]XP_057842882.1 importin subunit alpha-1b [Cryptomeria japonica]XP_057842883.1 importin subunit alpha-1b [Cryptomeria japonica]